MIFYLSMIVLHLSRIERFFSLSMDTCMLTVNNFSSPPLQNFFDNTTTKYIHTYI